MRARVALDEARVCRVNAGTSRSIRDVALFVIHGLGYDPETSRRNTPPEADESRASGSLLQANMRRRTRRARERGRRDRRAGGRGRPRAQPLPGLKFERGVELFRIADLSRVWIVADVFPQDARDVRAGTGGACSSRACSPRSGWTSISRRPPRLDAAPPPTGRRLARPIAREARNATRRASPGGPREAERPAGNANAELPHMDRCPILRRSTRNRPARQGTTQRRMARGGGKRGVASPPCVRFH
jgi:hypothetical protein